MLVVLRVKRKFLPILRREFLFLVGKGVVNDEFRMMNDELWVLNEGC